MHSRWHERKSQCCPDFCNLHTWHPAKLVHPLLKFSPAPKPWVSGLLGAMITSACFWEDYSDKHLWRDIIWQARWATSIVGKSGSLWPWLQLCWGTFGGARVTGWGGQGLKGICRQSVVCSASCKRRTMGNSMDMAPWGTSGYPCPSSSRLIWLPCRSLWSPPSQTFVWGKGPRNRCILHTDSIT